MTNKSVLSHFLASKVTRPDPTHPDWSTAVHRLNLYLTLISNRSYLAYALMHSLAHRFLDSRDYGCGLPIRAQNRDCSTGFPICTSDSCKPSPLFRPYCNALCWTPLTRLRWFARLRFRIPDCIKRKEERNAYEWLGYYAMSSLLICIWLRRISY